MYGGAATFPGHVIVFSILLVSSRILLPNCELQIFVLPCYKRNKKLLFIHTYMKIKINQQNAQINSGLIYY